MSYYDESKTQRKGSTNSPSPPRPFFHVRSWAAWDLQTTFLNVVQQQGLFGEIRFFGPVARLAIITNRCCLRLSSYGCSCEFRLPFEQLLQSPRAFQTPHSEVISFYHKAWQKWHLTLNVMLLTLRNKRKEITLLCKHSFKTRDKICRDVSLWCYHLVEWISLVRLELNLKILEV